VRNLGFSGDEVNTRHRSDEVPALELFLNMTPGAPPTKSGNTAVRCSPSSSPCSASPARRPKPSS